MGDIRFGAMNFLALREHSVKELKEKLGRKFSSVELIDEAISGLIAQNLQSDERFAQAFVGLVHHVFREEPEHRLMIPPIKGVVILQDGSMYFWGIHST